MNKDIEWFVDKWTKERDKSDVHDPMYHFINEFITDVKELDKPEVLSREWIEKHTWNNHYIGRPFVYVNDLQNLHVPKQELLVIPKYVADWITKYREVLDLYPALRRLEDNTSIWGRVYEWYRANTHDFVNAYLTGEYEVEDEQKYYVMNEENELILGWSQSAYMTPCIEGYEYMKYNGRENLFQLTEQEIKDYDSRYWTFAVKVEEVE